MQDKSSKAAKKAAPSIERLRKKLAALPGREFTAVAKLAGVAYSTAWNFKSGTTTELAGSRIAGLQAAYDTLHFAKNTARAAV